MKQKTDSTTDRQHPQEITDFHPGLWELRKRVWALRRWWLNLLLLGKAAGLHLLLREYNSHPLALEWTLPALLVLLAATLRIAFEWERVPILRFGRFHRTRGPGMFFYLPFVETQLGHIDSRIRVTDFSAERVLTRDAVPVFVDAVVFWMVWDAGKARLEVENYEYAVSLSARTALRDSIGRTALAAILDDRQALGRELQEILDAKTNPWGITALSVEIKEIIIPAELEDALSREAQAERERRARLLLAKTEEEIAASYVRAGDSYGSEGAGLQLRSLNILADTLKESGSMILVPSDAPHLMQKATAAALSRMQAEKTATDMKEETAP